jgi:hypothetical protein
MRLLAEIIPVEPDPDHAGEGSASYEPIFTRAFSAASFGRSLAKIFLPPGRCLSRPRPPGGASRPGFRICSASVNRRPSMCGFPIASNAVHDIHGVRQTPGPDAFPAEWAAVRQFELLQEAGNVSIYDLDPTHLLRTIRDLTAHMHGGGYRVARSPPSAAMPKPACGTNLPFSTAACRTAFPASHQYALSRGAERKNQRRRWLKHCARKNGIT